MDRSWANLEQACRGRLADQTARAVASEARAGAKATTAAKTASIDLAEFSARLDGEFRRLAELLWDLYRDRPDFAFQLQALVEETFAGFRARPEPLRQRDRELPPESGWFLSGTQVGAVAYVDLFAGTFNGLVQRIPYLKELGVTWLHLMPFFLAPEKESDGGYAVSSYRQTNPVLGSMDDLERLAGLLTDEGIALVADFVFNHTSDEHEWAMQAKAGERAHQDFYRVFADRADTAAYQASLRDIFPEARTGSFTWSPEMNKWVWTTFHSFQWDLNYANPAVFRAMAAEMVALANRGVSVLRLDAVAFIWKKMDTGCENLPQAHTIIKAFQSIARLACPSLLFKSEAIVHPDRIAEYIDLRECQVSYNPLLMAELWEASATKDARLLSLSMRKRHRLPAGCAWVNYVRCHDDIGWTFADEDAAELGIKGGDHRAFLNSFYLGEFPGSFSRGVSFQYNPSTGDRRICGTAASLAGVERAATEGAAEDLDTALRRVLLLYGVAFSAGGIPLLYLGDELGSLNDYRYEDDPAMAADSRWVHRLGWNDRLAAARNDASGIPGRVHAGLCTLARHRKAHAVFGAQAASVIETGCRAVLAFRKQAAGEILTVVGNFSDRPVELDATVANQMFAGRQGLDLLSGRLVLPDERVELEPCELLWILSSTE
jgi:amylosucrase